MASHTAKAPPATGDAPDVVCLPARDTREIASVEAEANRFVAEMAALGATFSVTRTGADVQWIYAPPAGMRDPLRRLKATFDLTRPGLHAAIVKSILRMKYAGAP